MIEEWKDVTGYEGLYQVSNLGNFRKTNKCNATKLGYSIRKNGYKTVSLANDGTYITEYLHRLVAQAFIPNPENKPTVDHINRDRLDNRVEIIEYDGWHDGFADYYVIQPVGESAYYQRIVRYDDENLEEIK